MFSGSIEIELFQYYFLKKKIKSNINSENVNHPLDFLCLSPNHLDLFPSYHLKIEEIQGESCQEII